MSKKLESNKKAVAVESFRRTAARLANKFGKQLRARKPGSVKKFTPRPPGTIVRWWRAPAQCKP